MTRDIDVSVVPTLHREGKYLARTLRSLSEAAAFARTQGITVELVAVQDRADHATRTIFEARTWQLLSRCSRSMWTTAR